MDEASRADGKQPYGSIRVADVAADREQHAGALLLLSRRSNPHCVAGPAYSDEFSMTGRKCRPITNWHHDARLHVYLSIRRSYPHRISDMSEVVQTSDFLADSAMVDADACALAQLCKHAINSSTPIPDGLCRALLSLQIAHSSAVFRHLSALAPFNVLLNKLPELLLHPFLQAQLKLSAKGQHDSFASSAMANVLQLDVTPAATPCTGAELTETVEPLTHEARAILNRSLALLTGLQHISIANHGLADADLAALIAPLRVHSQVTHIAIQGNTAEAVTADILASALPCWPHLQHFALSSRNPECGVDTSSMQAELSALAASMRTLTCLQHLQLGSSTLWADSCAVAIGFLTSLMHIEAAAETSICEVLASLTLLTYLKLQGGRGVCVREATHPLARNLSKLTHLQNLHVEGSSYSSMAAMPFASLLQLQHLELPGFCSDSASVPLLEMDNYYVDNFNELNIAAGMTAAEQGHFCGLRSKVSLQALTCLCLGQYCLTPAPTFFHHLGRLVATLPKLQHFELLGGGCWYEFNCYEWMCLAWAQARSWTSLSYGLHEVDFEPATVLTLPELRHLDVELFCGARHAGNAVDSICSMTQLTALSVAGNCIAEYLADLEFEVSVTPARGVGERLLRSLISMPHLHKLQLEDLVLSNSRQDLLIIALRLRCLRELSLRRCVLPTQVRWDAVRWHSLHELRVWDCFTDSADRVMLTALFSPASLRLWALRVLEVDAKLSADMVQQCLEDIKHSQFVVCKAVFSCPAVETQVAKFNLEMHGCKFVGQLPGSRYSPSILL